MVKELESLIEEFGDEIVTSIIQKLIEKDKRASSDLINSINYQIVTDSENSINLKIFAEDYFKWVELGRKENSREAPVDKTKLPRIGPLKKWCQIKGISNVNFPYKLRYSIYFNGIKPTPILSEVLASAKFNSTLKMFEDDYVTHVEDRINKLVQLYWLNKNI